jgi:hypothetical protein
MDDSNQVIKDIHIEPDKLNGLQVPGPALTGGTNSDYEQVIKNLLSVNQIRVILIT